MAIQVALERARQQNLMPMGIKNMPVAMRVAANRSRVTDLEAPSIRAALELLSARPTRDAGAFGAKWPRFTRARVGATLIFTKS